MKYLAKRLLSLVLVLAMVQGLGVNVFAWGGGVSTSAKVQLNQFYGYTSSNYLKSTSDSTAGKFTVYFGDENSDIKDENKWTSGNTTVGNIASNGLIIVPNEGYYVKQVIITCNDKGGYECKTAHSDGIASFGSTSTDSAAFVIPAANLGTNVTINGRTVWHTGAGAPYHVMVWLGTCPNPVTVTYDAGTINGQAVSISDLVTYSAQNEAATNSAVTYSAGYPNEVADKISYKYTNASIPSHLILSSNTTSVESNGSTYSFGGWKAYYENESNSWVEISGTHTAGSAIKLYYNIKLVAQWEKATAYTVTWKSQDGATTYETDTNVAGGASPSFDKSEPTKASDDDYTYTFAGWATSENQESGTLEAALPVVAGNVTYYAAFSKAAITETGPLTVSKTVSGLGADTPWTVTFEIYPQNTAVTAETTPTATITINGTGNTPQTGTAQVLINKNYDVYENFTLASAEVAGYQLSTVNGKAPVNAEVYTNKYKQTSGKITSGNNNTSCKFTNVYAANDYTLTVNYQYADGTTAATTHTETVAYGNAYSVASPVITGYTADIETVSGTMPAQDVEVTVTYSINDYTITYYLDGVVYDAGNCDGSFDYGVAITAADLPTKTGYTVKGWYTDSALTETSAVATIPSTMPAGNLSYYAFSTINSYGYTVEYYYDGTIDSSKTVTGSACYGTVIGSYTDKNIDGYKLDRDDAPLTITENEANNVIKVYYVKDSFGYTVNYYKGSVSSANLILTETNSGTFGAAIPYMSTKAAVNAEISADEDRLGIEYKDPGTTSGQTTITAVATDNVLNVVFAENGTFSVSYQWSGDAPEGVNLPASETAYDGETISLAANPENTKISHVSWTFEGWDKEGPFTDDATVIGTWSSVEDAKYTVSYVSEGATLQNTPDLYSGDDIPAYVGESDPTKVETSEYTYSFNGWSLTEGTEGAGSTVGSTDLVYTAQFTENAKPFTITYYLDGVQQYQDTFNYNAVVTARDLPADGTGYTVSGWYTQSTKPTEDTATAAIPSKMPAESLNFYAYTTPNTHTITYQITGSYFTNASYYEQLDVAYGTALTLISDDMAKSGYTFSGWSGLPATMPDEDVTVTGSYTLTPVTPSNPGTVLPTPTPITTTITPAPTPLTPEPEPEVTITEEPIPQSILTEDHVNYLMGYEDGSVQPEGNITRAEVAAIFFRLLKDEVRDANLTDENSFSDVAAGDWYCTPVSTLSALGILTGYPDGTFNPNGDITRAEMATIIAKFAEMEGSVELTFTDIAGHWAMNSILLAASNGWIAGYDDNTFRPDQAITRAETVTMINRVLERQPKDADSLAEGMQVFTDNFDKTAWYYLAIQEATNCHDFQPNDDGTETWITVNELIDWTTYEN